MVYGFVAALADGMPSMPTEHVSGTKLSVTACGDRMWRCLWT